MTTLLTLSPACPSLTFGSKKKKRAAAAHQTSQTTIDPQDSVSFNKQKTEEILRAQKTKEEAELEAQKEREKAEWVSYPAEAQPSSGSTEKPEGTTEIDEAKKQKKREKRAEQRRRKRETAAAQKETETKPKSPFVVPVSAPLDEAERKRVESELTRTDLVEDETAIVVGKRDEAQDKLRQLLTKIAPHRVAFMDKMDGHSGLKLLNPDLRFKLLIESNVKFPTLKRVFEEHCQSDLKKFAREYHS